MRKSGLHKQISSIFDGVPVPQNNDLPAEADASSVLMQPETRDTTEPQEPMEPQARPNPAPAAEPSRSSLAKRMSADPSECASAPAIQVDRPMPLPKSSAMAAKTGPSISSQARKALFGSSRGALDARQKKMAGLVGVLGVVFGVVMFISLGGVGQSQATAANGTTDNQTVQTQTPTKSAQDWKTPQPLPADLRDATSTASRQTDSTGDASGNFGSGELAVKGIVFSQNKPSAIINSEILTEGQSINGVTIVRITKDAVEFKSNDKQWTQQVQR
ncbi:MAG: hypothetical protein ACYTEN_06875 [Planctomycetota bacterium]|jgi:hypothetical protein